MMLLPTSVLLLFALSLTLAHDAGSAEQMPIADDARRQELESKWGFEWAFSGVSTFAHLPHVRCLTEPDEPFDIGIIGAPFDTAVSYRPGARFGPRAIRAASARQLPFRAANPRAGGLNPYGSWARLRDCGDIPATPFDNALALRQLTAAFRELGARPIPPASRASGSPYRRRPKLLTLGGDHSVALPALRALREAYGRPIAVVHFDAHLDTWHPAKYPSSWVEETPDGDAATFPQSHFNHGSMFWLAGAEGLIANGSSAHAGLRTRLSGADLADFADDAAQGWTRIAADDIDDVGASGVISQILNAVGSDSDGGADGAPVYLSVDIDVLDPGLAPGTGTPEPGGWTTRELIRILRGIEGLNVVGADIVEVSPAYDGPGEATALAAAQVGYEILTSMVRRGLMEQARVRRAGEGGGGDGGKDEL